MSTCAENKETETLLAPNKPTTEDESDHVPVAMIETEIKENVASIPKHLGRVSTLSADDKSVCETEDDSLISQNQLIFMARLGGRASLEHVHHSQPSASGSSDTFGFFVDFEGGEAGEESPKQNVDAETPSNALNAPNDILELHLSDQILWKHTAGKRPPQPEEEREYFEMLWRHNFAISNVEYNVPKESLIEGTSSCPYYEGTPNFSSYNLATDFMATDAEVAEVIHRLHAGLNMTLVEKTKPQIVNKKVKGGSNEDLTVLIKGDNAFATTFSKSFDRVNANGYREVDTVNISVASYRVVESKEYGKYAQFLVIYREGSIRDTIGVWKRYSDFEALGRKVVESHDGCSSVLANVSPLAVTEDGDMEHLPNAITSWRRLKKRQRWFRCLDAGYLSLKVFLLERFLRDILFESTCPNLLRDFVIYDKSGGGSG
jgi:hypothetical protein